MDIQTIMPKQKRVLKTESVLEDLSKQLEQLMISKKHRQTLVQELLNKTNLKQLVCIDCQNYYALLKAKDILKDQLVRIRIRVEEKAEQLFPMLQRMQEISLKHKDIFIEILNIEIICINILLVEEIDFLAEDLDDWLDSRNGNILNAQQRVAQVEIILNQFSILQKQGVYHNNLNLSSYLMVKKIPMLSLANCSLPINGSISNIENEEDINQRSQLLLNLPDECSVGIIIAIIDEWKKFESTKLEKIGIKKIQTILRNTGSLPFDLLEIDKTTLLFPIHSELIKNGLIIKNHRDNSINYKNMLENAKLNYIGASSDDFPQEKKVILINNSQVISSYIDSLSRGIRKQADASTVVLSYMDQGQEYQNEGKQFINNSHKEEEKKFNNKKIEELQQSAQLATTQENNPIFNEDKPVEITQELQLFKLEHEQKRQENKDFMESYQGNNQNFVAWQVDKEQQFNQASKLDKSLYENESRSDNCNENEQINEMQKREENEKENNGVCNEESDEEKKIGEEIKDNNISKGQEDPHKNKFLINNERLSKQEIIEQYNKYLMELKIQCSNLEEIRINMSVEQNNCCLYKISCVHPVVYIQLVLISIQPISLIGKNTMTGVLVPFIKIFNRPWKLKNEKNAIIILIGHPLLWIIKLLNIIFMVILIILYFIFLIVFLLIVNMLYLILRIIFLGLIPFGLIRLCDRLGVYISEKKSGVLYGRQLQFTWYALDSQFSIAKDFYLFHSKVIQLQRRK